MCVAFRDDYSLLVDFNNFVFVPFSHPSHERIFIISDYGRQQTQYKHLEYTFYGNSS